MKLIQLLKNINTLEVRGQQEVEVKTLSQDSRDTSFKDGLYFAVPGTQVDGHNYIDDVIKQGAICIVCSKLPEILKSSVSYVLVNDVRHSLGLISGNFYGNPSEKLKIIAVTGTNGKTSVATFISQTLEHLGKKTLLLSTAGDLYNGQAIEIERKAPSSLESIEQHKVMAEYLARGAEYCCLEATSQGLDQLRLSGVNIDVGIFMNLADDHLDYHGDMNHYAKSKKLLFDSLSEKAVAISNIDDEYGHYMLSNSVAQNITFSQQKGDVVFRLLSTDLSGMQLEINSVSLSVPVVGEFNAYNITATFACLINLGFDKGQVRKSLSLIQGVPGRMQLIQNNRNILALVDYAHSSDALFNVLGTLQKVPHIKIFTIIGCGGDRDRSKRAPMAKVSHEMSDYVIFTADNPRTEDLHQIFEDMRKGIPQDKDNYVFIDSREEAIKTAVQKAAKGDIILVAGKGHEDYQIIGTEKKHFDDVELLEKYLSI